MVKFFFRIFLTVHIFFYRLTNGKFGGKVQGLRVLLLTTTGRKSGKKRTIPLGYFKEEGSFIIIASYAGSDKNPAWYLNLKNNPIVSIHENDQIFNVRAEVVSDEERSVLWDKLIKYAPGYANYEKKTSRKIPLVRLQPV